MATVPQNKTVVHGMIAEFTGPAELLSAASKVRDAGYERFDCHSPFPIHGMDAAMGLRPSNVGFIAGISGLIGGVFGLTLQWWVSAVDYPIVISGKPYFSYPAYVPVTFGLTVLFAAIGAFIGMLITNRLPKLWHAVFYSDRFSKVTDDGFFMSIEAEDRKFDEQATKALLESAGATYVEILRGE